MASFKEVCLVLSALPFKFMTFFKVLLMTRLSCLLMAKAGSIYSDIEAKKCPVLICSCYLSYQWFCFQFDLNLSLDIVLWIISGYLLNGLFVIYAYFIPLRYISLRKLPEPLLSLDSKLVSFCAISKRARQKINKLVFVPSPASP